MMEAGTCSACGWPAQRTVISPAPDVEGRVWWHVDPRAMAVGRSHPTRAEFIPDREQATQ